MHQTCGRIGCGPWRHPWHHGRLLAHVVRHPWSPGHHGRVRGASWWHACRVGARRHPRHLSARRHVAVWVIHLHVDKGLRARMVGHIDLSNGHVCGDECVGDVGWVG